MPGTPDQSTAATSAENVVQRQLDAFNARDADTWAATYADDARQFEHPDKLLAAGIAQIKERIAVRFKEPNLYAQLLTRIVMENIVVDHERISRTFPEGPGTIELVAMYEVAHGKIVTAWFRSGKKTLDAEAS